MCNDRLWLNDGDGNFVNTTDNNFLADPDFNGISRRHNPHDPYTYAACLADVDADGDPDLFLSGTQNDQLWRGDGSGGFTRDGEPDQNNVIQNDLGTLSQVGSTTSCAFADVDQVRGAPLSTAPWRLSASRFFTLPL